MTPKCTPIAVALVLMFAGSVAASAIFFRSVPQAGTWAEWKVAPAEAGGDMEFTIRLTAGETIKREGRTLQIVHLTGVVRRGDLPMYMKARYEVDLARLEKEGAPRHAARLVAAFAKERDAFKPLTAAEPMWAFFTHILVDLESSSVAEKAVRLKEPAHLAEHDLELLTGRVRTAHFGAGEAPSSELRAWITEDLPFGVAKWEMVTRIAIGREETVLTWKGVLMRHGTDAVPDTKRAIKKLPVDEVAAKGKSPLEGKHPPAAESLEGRQRTGMHLPFNEVELMSRPAMFVSYAEWVVYLDVSRDREMKIGPRLPGPKSIQIAVRPDGSRFYMGTRTGLAEFTGDAKLLRTIPNDEFRLGGRGFGWSTAASNDRLCFTALSRRNGGFVGEWLFSEAPESRVLVDAKGYIPGVAFDLDSRRAFVPFETLVIDFEAATCSSGKWPERKFTHADFDPRRGLLLSYEPQAPRSKPAGQNESRKNIVRFDPSTSESDVVTEGSYAVWGPDDWVYFCVGSSQLWRCKEDGSQRAPVYVGSSEPVFVYCSPPRLSDDRSWLAYQALGPQGRGGLAEMVLMDLRKKEYRRLRLPTVDQFAWVIDAPPEGAAARDPVK